MENLVKNFLHVFSDYPFLQTLLGLGALIFAAIVINFIVRHILLRIVYRILSVFINAGEFGEIRTAIGYLANIAPTIVVYDGIKIIPGLPDKFIAVVQNVADAFTTFVVALAFAAFLSFLERLYNRRRGRSHNRSIKGIVQVAKIVIFIIAAIFMIASLINKSPLVLLSGLGAMAAIIMLISQDTLLSLVAGIQLSTTDMVRIGDWITVPSLNADGDVVDMALHTIKVQNFDNTITSIPTRKLVTDSFINWRGMQESGGRRIKRALNIDQMSIRFLNEDDYEKLSEFRALRDYVKKKKLEIEQWNSSISKNPNLVNSARKLTNIGTFRAYALAYLENNPAVRKDMTLLVRQLAPTSTGLPLEIYCFTNTVKWLDYEAIQSDIFDHFYSILSIFGLRVFQESTGNFTELVMSKPLPVMEMQPGGRTAGASALPIEMPDKGPR